MSIAEARGLADGATATIEGVLTTDLGALESGRGGFVQDATGGIALYLDAAVAGDHVGGHDRHAARDARQPVLAAHVRVAEAAIASGSNEALPAAVEVQAVGASEPFEGVRVHVQGVIAGSPDSLSDGTGITVDDGSGPIRVVVGPRRSAAGRSSSGMTVAVAGPLGQRDSSGTGSAGYRIHATLAGELEWSSRRRRRPPPRPPTPGPTATPTPLPTAGPTPTPTPVASADPASDRDTTTDPDADTDAHAGAIPLATVRALPIGSNVRTTGVVVAEAGRLGTPALLGDRSGDAGLVVHLPAEARRSRAGRSSR